MTGPKGLNGSGGERPSNIASLEDARRRAEQKRREAKHAAAPGGRATTRDWIIGGVVLAMALAMIGTWIWGLAAPGPGPAGK